MRETRAITVEKVLPYAAEKIWHTLTSSELIAKWLMPNDFAAAVGHRFNFRSRPMGDWDGVVHCEVLACEPPKLLRYSWKGGSDSSTSQAPRLDTSVTWTLTPVAGGTHLKMVHDGFVLPEHQSAYDAMSPGWGRVMEQVAAVTAQG